MDSTITAILLYQDKAIIKSMIIIGVCIFLDHALKSVFEAIINRKIKKKSDKRKITLLKLTSNVIKYVLILIAVIGCLKAFGYDITSLVAGLSVAGVIAGLALQDALKDIIMGANVILDNYFNVGDIIRIDDFEGRVIGFGMKATKIKNVDNDETMVIANRNITKAVTLSDIVKVHIPTSYEIPIENVENVLKEAIKQIEKYDFVKYGEYQGVDEFGQSAMIYGIRFHCAKDMKLQTLRKSQEIIKRLYDKEGWSIPYTRVDIHEE